MGGQLKTDRVKIPGIILRVTGWFVIGGAFAMAILWFLNPMWSRSGGTVATYWITTPIMLFLVSRLVRPIRTLFKPVTLAAGAVPSLGATIGWSILLAILMALGQLVEAMGALEYVTPSSPSEVFKRVQFTWWFISLICLIVRFFIARKIKSLARLDQRDRDAIARREAEIAYERDLHAQRNKRDTPSSPGTRTQYDANIIKDWPQPTGHRLMFGTPGAGLDSSGFAKSKVAKGQLGEQNFAKALAAERMLDRFATFWSIYIPDEYVGRNEKYSSDIDCVVVTGRTIFVLDIKYYMQGDITWKTHDSGKLVAVDNPTGAYVGSPRTMSRNMEMAHALVSRRSQDARLPYKVVSYVVLMPTNHGIGTVEPGTVWPGDIPVLTLPAMLDMLQAEPSINMDSSDAEDTVRMFKNLLKDESYWASVEGSQSGTQPGLGARTSAEVGPTSAGAPQQSAPRQSQSYSQPASPSGVPSFGSGSGASPQFGSGPSSVHSNVACRHCGAAKPPFLHACPNCGR